VRHEQARALRRSLTTTNAAESLISRTRHVIRNVKRWRDGQMVLRWVAAGVLEAVTGIRRMKGHKATPQFVAALRTRDQQLWLDMTSREGDVPPPQGAEHGLESRTVV
jgi:hypothetical protein